MADRETLQWRRKAHEAIDPIWKDGLMPRKEVYRRIKNHFGVEWDIHVGESDVSTCKGIIHAAMIIRNKAEKYERA